MDELNALDLRRRVREGGGGRTERSFLDFVIDGRSLLAQLDSEAGDLCGPLGWGDPETQKLAQRRLRLEAPLLIDGEREPLFVCRECGELECGAVTARISASTGVVRWFDFAFENGSDDPSPIPGIGPFSFEFRAYRDVLGLSYRPDASMRRPADPSAGRADGMTVAGHFEFHPRTEDLDRWPPPAAFDFVVATPQRFVLIDGERRAISEGATTWFVEGDEATFVGTGRCSIPRRLRELLFPSDELWEAVAQAGAKSKGHAETDQARRIVTMLRRTSGVSSLSRVELVGPSPGTFRWSGPVRSRPSDHATARVWADGSEGLPTGSTAAAVHLEAELDGLVSYSEPGPSSTLDVALAWAWERSDWVTLAVNRPDGEREHYSAGTASITSMPSWPPPT